MRLINLLPISTTIDHLNRNPYNGFAFNLLRPGDILFSISCVFARKAGTQILTTKEPFPDRAARRGDRGDGRWWKVVRAPSSAFSGDLLH